MQLPPEFADAFKTLTLMLVNGFFSGLGAAMSYFYHLEKTSTGFKIKKLLLWITLGWAVGAVIGEFQEFYPPWALDHLYGALFLAGAFWKTFWQIGYDKVSRISKW